MRFVRWNSTASPATPPLMTQCPPRRHLRIQQQPKDLFPIQTDIQLLSLLQKRANASKEAAQEFAAAERPDLKEKEDAQVAVLEEYASQVETLSAEEMQAIVTKEIAAIKEAGTKLNKGLILKALFAPNGPLDGKPVNRNEVAKLVNEAVSA
ncbi:hypothetical protein N7509_001270 [Penicillium cosmopolitanum]|uniref:Altered inheritance of mitochondria protein 41 n=1 Tax=Penicillium cosmopolitanum TaxID=1131564 RepID=A0A9W9WCD2_9EURO|nr:uncharacterized protein N7509_001270 [Penicillium cosmopolitanum]KAJ5414643.1 hypothetical protein N7509_001270 [Penicillium cosmopolitanum]